MTNAEHTQMRYKIDNWSIEDLNMVKSMIEIKLMEMDIGKPEFQEWMARFIQEIDQAPRHLTLVK